jgi:hypothetical protein
LYFTVFVLGGLIFSAITQFFLDLTQRTGNAPGLFALTGISMFVQGLLVAGALTAGVLHAGTAIISLIFTAVILLQFYFLTNIIGKAYGMSAGKVLLSVLLALIPAFVSAVITACAGIAIIAAVITGLVR